MEEAKVRLGIMVRPDADAAKRPGPTPDRLRHDRVLGLDMTAADRSVRLRPGRVAMNRRFPVSQPVRAGCPLEARSRRRGPFGAEIRDVSIVVRARRNEIRQGGEGSRREFGGPSFRARRRHGRVNPGQKSLTGLDAKLDRAEPVGHAFDPVRRRRTRLLKMPKHGHEPLAPSGARLANDLGRRAPSSLEATTCGEPETPERRRRSGPAWEEATGAGWTQALGR